MRGDDLRVFVDLVANALFNAGSACIVYTSVLGLHSRLHFMKCQTLMGK